MDIGAVMTQAHKNKKECSLSTVSRYNTNVKPAKKLPRPNVDPNAVKAFLEKKRKEETNDLIEAQKKKEELMKLRDATKNTKKANAMARRTKDNLKVYRGEDVLGLYEEPKKRRRNASPPLSPEADRRHKAFMKNIVPKVKVPGINDDDSDDGYKEPMLEMDERKRKKMEKRRAKARSSSNLEFSDLLQLAEKQKNKMDDSSSSSSEESDSGEDSDGSTDKYGRRLTPEEKYQRERRKRRELEERLKMSATNKSQPVSNNHNHKAKHDSPKGNLSNFKIGKLNSGMSEESKRAKVKALMEKLKQSSQSRKDERSPVSSKEGDGKRREKGTERNAKVEKIRKSHSSPHLSSLIEKDEKRISEMKHTEKDGKFSTSNGTKSPSLKLRKEAPPSNERVPTKHPPKPPPLQKNRTFKTTKSQSELRQTEMSNHFKAVKRKSEEPERSSSSKVKREKAQVSNPYKHTVVDQRPVKRPATDTLVDPWAKSAKGVKEAANRKSLPPQSGAKCTLSVTSESVKTNYPGVAQLDPYIQSYKKTGKIIPKLTPEMVARYKAAIIRKMRQDGMGGRQTPPPPPRRKYGVIGDESDEYDSELDDFIVDGEEEEVDDGDVDVSSHIKQIFGYDKSKYGRESEWELSRMDASYKDIEKEEKRSLRIAREEDAREARLEEERNKRLAQKKKKR